MAATILVNKGPKNASSNVHNRLKFGKVSKIVLLCMKCKKRNIEKLTIVVLFSVTWHFVIYTLKCLCRDCSPYNPCKVSAAKLFERSLKTPHQE